MSVIVDSLVVQLGLDAKGFTDGIKGSADAVSNLATRVLAMAGIATSIEGVVGYFKDLHFQLAEVGFAARNLGIAGSELSRFGEVSELAGGQAQDAISSVMGLQGAIFNLQYRGQLSDGLAMLQRFGVAYLTASGHMRDFKDIATDAAAAVDRQAAAAGMNQGERLQLSMSMGFTGGVAAAVAQGGKGLEQALAESSIDQKVLTSRVIDGQVKLDQALTRTHYVIESNTAVILNRLTPEIIHLVTKLGELANDALPKIVRAIDGFEHFFKDPPPWLKQIEDTFKNPPEWIKSIEKFLGPTGTLIVALGGLAIAIGAGSAIVSGLASLAGALALSPFKAGAGAVGAVAGAAGGRIGILGYVGAFAVATMTVDALEANVPKSWKEWMDNTSLLPGLELFDKDAKSSWDPSGPLGRIFLGPNLTAPPPTPNAPRAPGGASGSWPTAMNGGSHVQIDSMTINTRATDAYEMAANANDALNRKLLVANADSGING